MTWEAVHQFVPTLIRGDAIGDHVIRLRDQQREAGRDAQIYVDVEREDTADDALPLTDFARSEPREKTLLVYHVAQASDCAAALAIRDEPLALYFHNFTPIDLLAGWDPGAAGHLLDAERQLVDLAPQAVLGICPSRFSTERLEDLGLPTCQVTIPVSGPAGNETHPIDRVRRRVLFVGRVAPNKAFHDLIAAADVLRHLIPDAEFRLVGGPTSLRYTEALQGLIAARDLGATITFTGRVSADQLAREYQEADVFCCLSDHEGYGVPLLEAMSHGVPVVAFDSSAVGETVGGAAVLISRKDPELVATAIARVLEDDDLAQRLQSAGTARAASFSEARCAREMDAALNLAATLAGVPA